ncbi:MAG: TonB-dependent receptor [Pyrinomonadaceae bacterium]|nr:TonB-dependent receptor [Pyrinomonadaceae bacterium]
MTKGNFLFHKILLTLVCVLAGAAQPVFAQQPDNAAAIDGRVTDPQGAGVAGAVVTLHGRARTAAARFATVTDEAGAYRFARLAAPGEYIVEVEAAGFARTTASVERIERGASVTLDVSLQLAGVSTEVVVTAAGAPQTVDEVSKAVTVVGRREIEERDESSIPEALRTVPGLRVQQLGGPGTLTSIRTRGLRNQDTAVLIDGLRFRDASTLNGDALSFLSDLVVTNTSRVEVLRGSGSSLYGTNAIGGVVNIVTDEGGGPVRGSLLAEGGGLGTFRGRAQVAGGSGANRVIYSAGLTHLNTARGVDTDDAARNTSGQGRVLFRLTPTATLSARLYAADTFLQLNESPQAVGTLPASGIIDGVPLSLSELRRFESGASLSSLNVGAATFVPSANDPDNSQATRFFTGALVFAERPTERFGYTISYQGLTTSRVYRDGPGGIGFEPTGGTTRNDFDGRIQTLAARADFQLGRFNFVTAGYEFENENYVNRSFPVSVLNNSEVDVTERSQTFFVQDQLRLLDDRLQLSAAFRVQSFTLDNPRFTPATNAPYQGMNFAAPPNAYTGDGSIAYFFRAAGTKLRAHVGNGYRAPSLYERFGTFFSSFSGSFSALGDPGLRPERSIAFDAGVDQTLFGNRTRASATYFYTRLQEVIGFGPVATFNRGFGGYLNTQGGLARGVELSATFAPTTKLDVFTAYTFTNSDERTPRLGGIIGAFVIPDHQFTLVATQRFGQRVAVNFDLAASSKYLAPVSDNRTFASRVYRFDGIVKADVVASYTLPLDDARALRFFGKVENLFDRENYESGFRTPGRTARAGAAFNF